jgi:methyl-accepting chemotaxis protein
LRQSKQTDVLVAFSLSRLSITRQFTLLAALGMALTLAGVSLALKRSYDLSFDAKRNEVRHIAEAGASVVRLFIEMERDGTMTRQDAQRQAKAAIGAIRFDGSNYAFIYDFDGMTLVHSNKAWIGTNRRDSVDAKGHYSVRAMLDVAKSGKPGFVKYYNTKPGATVQSPKMSYVIGLPEWGWLLSTGLYVDDVYTSLIDGVEEFAVVFTPLFIAFIALVVLIRRSVSRLLVGLAGSMKRLAAGDYDTDIVGLQRRDEIGQMAKAIHVFKDTGIKLKATEAEAAHRAEIAEGERQANAAARGEIQRQQDDVVATLATGLDHLAHGDFTTQLNNTFAAEYEKLRADFNATAASLRSAMRTISSATTGINSGSDQIASASDELARRTEQQAANLEETAAALNSITDTVKKMAVGAGEAAEVVATTRGSAETSGKIVQEAVEAMDAIRTSSNQITQIIGVIDEIAFQTNLLALNAGVEAARAGEAGRGFAVVASEVRSLAQRSAQAAKEIKGLIATSTDKVDSGVALVDRTGAALHDIIEKITSVDTLVRNISASSKDQATSLAEINIAVAQMDQIVQQNAAMVEETTAAAHTLKNETQDLTTMVGRFRIGVEPKAVAAPSPARRPPAASTAGRRGSATAAAPKVAAEAAPDWEEF